MADNANTKRKRLNERKTTEIFIEEAKAIHGDAYNYDRVVYVNTKTKVEIFCNTCQEYFWQAPAKHLIGRGCPKCGAKKCQETRSSIDERFDKFVQCSIEMFGDIYEFDKSTFTNYKEKMRIVCKIHGTEMWETPDDFIRKIAC